MTAGSDTDPQSGLPQAFDARARVAIDLGAESCRVSLLRWRDGSARIELLDRIPNGPVDCDGALRWPLEQIVEGLDEGLRKAAAASPEGIASIAVDGWAVDYVRLDANGRPMARPFCYRDERTVAAKEAADRAAAPEWIYRHTGAHPHRLNTVYQLLADEAAVAAAPWVCLPEYMLHRLGARRVAEHTNATHTGMVDLGTGNWCQAVTRALGIPWEGLPEIVRAGTVVGKLAGPLAELGAFRNTLLIAPACHDTASAIAGIATPFEKTAYICSGTWSLVGTLIDAPITTNEAFAAGFTNLGAAGGGFCFHTNVNGMWMLKQCLDAWAGAGRRWDLHELIRAAERCAKIPGTVPVSAAPLLLAGDMPARLNQQLRLAGYEEIADVAGNECAFARLIFESLAEQYAATLASLQRLLGFGLERIHILGGGSLNQLLTRLTEEKTGLPVERGHAESSTMGNFAVQLAAAEADGAPVSREGIGRWARLLQAA